MVGTIIGAHTVIADDFVIEAPSAITNGGNVLNGNDSLTITGSGSISTAGTDAVDVTGSNNTITNSGSIGTTGNTAMGIQAVDDTTITNFGSITTTGNNSHAIDLDNNSTITNSGTITTQGSSSNGVDFRNNNTIFNSGSISMEGNNAHGLDGLSNNTIINSGSIFTGGTDGYAIWLTNNNTVINTGSVTTMGLRGHAISTDGNSTITNSGSLSTAGNFAYGIWVYDSNTITNTGQISSSGTQAHGIDARDSNIVTNSGSISTSGTNGDAMWNRNNNTVINNGSLYTSGNNAHGIRGNDNNIVTNSGKVVSARANAFDLDNANTLNLLAPSFLGGTINMGTNTTLNITTGPSHSVLWDLSTGTMAGGAPTFGGPVPVFYNAATQKVATLDPTAFAASTDSLSEMSGNLSSVIGLRLRGSLASGHSGPGNANLTTATVTTAKLDSYVSTREASVSKDGHLAFVEDAGSHEFFSSGRSWVTVLGARSKYDGNSATNDRTLSQWGVASGYDWSPSANMKLGVLGGYTTASLNADSRYAKTFDNKSSGLFAGFYGRRALGTSFFDFSFTGGVNDLSGKRFVNDNLAPLGVSYAKSSYLGVWASPEIAFGTHFDIGMGWVATSTARLRYASQWLDGYRETGSSANAEFDSRQVAVGEGSLELAATKNTEKGSATIRIGYLYNTSLGDSSTNVTMIGQTVSVPTFGEDRHAMYIGTNLNIIITETINMEVGGQLVGNQEFTSVGGNLKLVSKF